MDHNEVIGKEIRISLSIFWDIVIQGENEVMRYLSNSFIYELTLVVATIYLKLALVIAT